MLSVCSLEEDLQSPDPSSLTRRRVRVFITDRQQQRNSPVNFIKNMDFSYRLNANGEAYDDFTVTAVAGHLTSRDFSDQYRKWNSCDPFDLFEAPIITFVSQVRRETRWAWRTQGRWYRMNASLRF